MQISCSQRLCVIVVFFASFAAVSAPISYAEDTIQQGQWRTKEEVLEMVNPLLDPEIVEKRKSTPMTVEFCVRSGSLQTLLGVGNEKLGLCNGPMNIGNGKISIERTCTTGLSKSTQKIEGTYTTTRVETTRESTTDSPKGPVRSKTKAVL